MNSWNLLEKRGITQSENKAFVWRTYVKDMKSHSFRLQCVVRVRYDEFRGLNRFLSYFLLHESET